MEKDLFPIGRVVKLHGIRGKIKALYFGDDLSRFLYREIFIEDSSGQVHPYQILEAVPQPPRLILSLKGIEAVEDARLLIGKEMLVPKAALPDLSEDEYYWSEIVGMIVETEKGKRIGRVKEVFPTGANDVFVVQGKRGEIFLPATKEVIQNIDREKSVIRVRWMEGLWEDEDEV